MSEDQKKIEHLKMIQSVIDRMGRNSFQLKAWSAALLGAILILLTRVPKDHNLEQARYYIFVPFILFFALDGYYLWQERLFRRLYTEVCIKNCTDLKMDTGFGENLLDRIAGYLGACFFTYSKWFPTTLLFHAGIIIIVLWSYPFIQGG